MIASYRIVQLVWRYAIKAEHYQHITFSSMLYDTSASAEGLLATFQDHCIANQHLLRHSI
jgi:hypothetical protein